MPKASVSYNKVSELISHLSRAEVQFKMKRVEPAESHSEEIAQELSLTVFDQPEACQAVGRRLAMFETNLADPNRPLGVLYFLGAPGSGKTEMSRAVSKYMFNDPDSPRLKILNMAEYKQSHYAARFTGSPPGYVDHDRPPVISHDWLHKGRSVIVLDEIEKAHPDVHQTFLSVFDRGKLDARNGKSGEEPLDFRNSLIILTSNVASGEIGDVLAGRGHQIGFGVREPANRKAEVKRVADKGLKERFTPEFLDRIDEFVIFNPLENAETLNAIVTKFLGERNDYLRQVLERNAPYIGLTTEARQFILARAGKEGGRAIRKALELYIFDRMADIISTGDYFRRPFIADIEDENTVWYTDNPEINVVQIDSKRARQAEPVARRVTPDDSGDGSAELKKKDEPEESIPPNPDDRIDDPSEPEEEKSLDTRVIELGFVTPNHPTTHIIEIFTRVQSLDGEDDMMQHVKLPLVNVNKD